MTPFTNRMLKKHALSHVDGSVNGILVDLSCSLLSVGSWPSVRMAFLSILQDCYVYDEISCLMASAPLNAENWID